jgi:hypothetical protein
MLNFREVSAQSAASPGGPTLSDSTEEVVFAGYHQPSVVGVAVEPFDQVRYEANPHVFGDSLELCCIG